MQSGVSVRHIGIQISFIGMYVVKVVEKTGCHWEVWILKQKGSNTWYNNDDGSINVGNVFCYKSRLIWQLMSHTDSSPHTDSLVWGSERWSTWSIKKTPYILASCSRKRASVSTSVMTQWVQPGLSQQPVLPADSLLLWPGCVQSWSNSLSHMSHCVLILHPYEHNQTMTSCLPSPQSAAHRKQMFGGFVYHTKHSLYKISWRSKTVS